MIIIVSTVSLSSPATDFSYILGSHMYRKLRVGNFQMSIKTANHEHHGHITSQHLSPSKPWEMIKMIKMIEPVTCIAYDFVESIWFWRTRNIYKDTV